MEIPSSHGTAGAWWLLPGAGALRSGAAALRKGLSTARALGSFAGGDGCSLVCLEMLAGKRGGENYLSDSEVAMNYIKL